MADEFGFLAFGILQASTQPVQALSQIFEILGAAYRNGGSEVSAPQQANGLIDLFDGAIEQDGEHS